MHIRSTFQGEEKCLETMYQACGASLGTRASPSDNGGEDPL